jgi:hypothetical protein
MRGLLVLLLLAAFAWEAKVIAGIHRAPIIIPGFKVRALTRFPLASYRAFRTDKDGSAVPIAFQIDELNEWGDYILTNGKNLINDKSNGIFDPQDELSFMGDDVGPATPPTKWSFAKPAILKELRFDFRGDSPFGANEGAVYIGVYFKDIPKLSSKNYVVFNKEAGEVNTSRFRYRFDKKNYLVVESIDMVSQQAGKPDNYLPLIDSSTFYMKADLKYFLTFEVNHRDINSSLEAYKVGPIRTIVRVIFFYSFLKINFELGMYTEVSIFSNSVNLPAVIYNPLDGQKNLNSGSSFYYGFAAATNPKDYSIETNIPLYQPPSSTAALMSLFKQEPKSENFYWLSLAGPDRMMYFEVIPSQEMLELKNLPFLYREDLAGNDLRARTNEKAQPLGKSPVNLGLGFDLTKFKEGEHRIAFRLFFENSYNEKELKNYPKLHNWRMVLRNL